MIYHVQISDEVQSSTCCSGGNDSDRSIAQLQPRGSLVSVYINRQPPAGTRWSIC